jgi:O-antigen/teichoic acid export membrane protein
MRRDLLSAYAASGARVLSWVAVSALLFRADPLAFAMLALIRGAVGLLNYTTLGLAPAMVRSLAQAREAREETFATEHSAVLSYARPTRDPVQVVYASGKLAALITGVVGLALALLYAAGIEYVHKLPAHIGASEAAEAALFMGIGTVLRLMSEAPGAVIQTTASIVRDNVLVVIAELAWVGLAMLGLGMSPLASVTAAFLGSGVLLLTLRWIAAGAVSIKHADMAVSRRLLAFGSLVALAQLADFLYAPTDYILINRFVSPDAVAIYAPAVQVDAGLLLLVGALAAVLLPKAALAHAAGEGTRLVRYYVRGTLGSVALLLVGSAAAYLLAPWALKVWLGNSMPATRAILPLVLIHTVLGGSSGVGRSILLAMGKARPFAIAMLVAGLANVICSYVFVAHMGLGLRGVIYGTIAVAVGRCVIWQPWYVLRTLRRDARAGRMIQPEATPAVAPEPL